MKTFLTRTLPLLCSIFVGTALSWVCIYAFWFAVWTFHTVPAARFCDAVGNILLTPGRLIFELSGGDQSSIFFDPITFAGTNGLVLGLVFYSIFRFVLDRRESRAAQPAKPAPPQPVVAKAG